jgi:hypothetical protein
MDCKGFLDHELLHLFRFSLLLFTNTFGRYKKNLEAQLKLSTQSLLKALLKTPLKTAEPHLDDLMAETKPRCPEFDTESAVFLRKLMKSSTENPLISLSKSLHQAV